MLKLVRLVQKLKNDKNRDDSLLLSWASPLPTVAVSYASAIQRTCHRKSPDL